MIGEARAGIRRVGRLGQLAGVLDGSTLGRRERVIPAGPEGAEFVLRDAGFPAAGGVRRGAIRRIRLVNEPVRYTSSLMRRSTDPGPIIAP